MARQRVKKTSARTVREAKRIYIRQVSIDNATLERLKTLLGPDVVVPEEDMGKIEPIAGGGCCRVDW